MKTSAGKKRALSAAAPGKYFYIHQNTAVMCHVCIFLRSWQKLHSHKLITFNYYNNSIPIARAGVIAANMPWYKQNTSAGILSLAIDASSHTPRKNMCLKSPMKKLALSLNVKEYPNKNHYKKRDKTHWSHEIQHKIILSLYNSVSNTIITHCMLSLTSTWTVTTATEQKLSIISDSALLLRAMPE